MSSSSSSTDTIDSMDDDVIVAPDEDRRRQLLAGDPLAAINALRPRGWDNITPRRGTRVTRQFAPTPTDIELAQLLGNQRTPGGVLVKPRKQPSPIVSPATRLQQAAAAKQANKNALRQRFVQYRTEHPELASTDISELIARAHATQRATATPRPQRQLTEVGKALRRANARKPAIPTRESLYPLTTRFAGNDTSATVENQNWINYTPQTLPDEQYERMMKNLGEIVGVAHARPQFDPRLLTKESAQEIYGTDGYDYYYDDMDADPLTPATLRIVRKAYTTPRGVQVPARTVAVGGYRVPDASSANTERLLTQMAYYSDKPTKAARKTTKLSAYKAANPAIFGEKKIKITGYKQIIRYLYSMLDAYYRTVGLHVNEPSAGNPGYIVIGNPLAESSSSSSEQILFNVDTTGTFAPIEPLVLYEINAIAFRTIMSNVAMLFGYYYFFPTAATILQSLPANKKTPKVNAAIELFTHPDIDISNGLIDAYSTSWEILLLYPKLETSILNDATVQEAIGKAIRLYDTGTEQFANPSGSTNPAAVAVQNFELLLSTVCYNFMNVKFDIPYFAYFGATPENAAIPQHEIGRELFAEGCVFRLVPDELKNQCLHWRDDNYIPIDTMTAKGWKKITQEHPTMVWRGFAEYYVDPAVAEEDRDGIITEATKRAISNRDRFAAAPPRPNPMQRSMPPRHNPRQYLAQGSAGNPILIPPTD